MTKKTSKKSFLGVLSHGALCLYAAGAIGVSAYCSYALIQMAGFFGPLSWATYLSLGLVISAGYKAYGKIRQTGQIIRKNAHRAPQYIASQTASPARTAAAAASLCLAVSWNLATHVRTTLDTENNFQPQLEHQSEISKNSPATPSGMARTASLTAYNKNALSIG